jgi:hypothetical protein
MPIKSRACKCILPLLAHIYALVDQSDITFLTLDPLHWLHMVSIQRYTHPKATLTWWTR